MLSWIRRQAGKKQHKTKKSRRHAVPKPTVQRCPSIEALEDRTLLAVVIWTGAAVDDQDDANNDGVVSFFDNNGGASGDTPGTNRWSYSGNWLNGDIPNNGDDVIFPAGTPKSSGNPNGPLVYFPQDDPYFFAPPDLHAPFNGFNSFNDLTGLTLNSVTIADRGYVIGGNGITLLSEFLGSLSSGSSTWDIDTTLSGTPQSFRISNANGTVEITGNLSQLGSNARALIKDGPGTLILGGDNTFTGLVEVTQGILGVESPTALGSSAVGTVVSSGATLEVLDTDVADEALVLSGVGVGGIGALFATGLFSSEWTGEIILSPSASIGVSGVGAAPFHYQLTLSGVRGISGSGDLTKVGGGTLILAIDNSYAGHTFINAGTVSMRSAGALGPGSDTTVAGGATLAVRGLFTVNEDLLLNGDGVNDATGNPTGAFRSDNLGTDVTWAGPVTLQSDTSVGGDNNTQITVTGNFSGNGSLTKIGLNNFILTNANTGFRGDTIINNGTVMIRDALALGPGSASGGGTITVDRTNVYPGGTLLAEGSYTVDKTLNVGTFGYNSQGALRVAGPVGAYDLAEVEPNDTIASAQNVDGGLWNQAHNLNVANSTVTPHLSIIGTGDGTFDYYSFTAAANSMGTFDIDFQNFNTELFLYDAAGNLLAQNDDDSQADAGDGVSSTRDSALNFTFTTAGTYVIGIGRFNSTGSAGGITGTPPAAGDSYTLHISLENHARHPSVPNSQIVWGGPINITSTTSFAVATGSQLQVTSDIGGPTGTTLEKTGDGTLILSAANDYLGTITLQSGVTVIQNPTSLGPNGSEQTIVSVGATLQFGNGINVGNETLTLSGTGFNNMGAMDVTGGTNSWAGAINFAGTGDVVVNIESGQMTFNGVLSGGGGLRKRGPGTLIYSNSVANTTTGSTTVEDGTMLLSMGNGIQALGGPVIVGDGIGADNSAVLRELFSNQIADGFLVTVNQDGLFDLNNNNETVGSVGNGALQLQAGNVTTGTGLLTLGGNVTNFTDPAGGSVINGRISLGNATRTFAVQRDSTLTNDLTVNAVISSSGANVGLIKGSVTGNNGFGRMIINQAATYTGATTVNTGFLRIGTSNAIPTGTALTISGGAFELNGNNQTVASLAGAGGTLDLGGGVLTTGASNTSTSFSGGITGAGGVTKVGAGTLTLGGASLGYTGTTRVNAGTVLVNADQRNAAVNVAAGATLGGTGRTGPITLDGILSPGTSPGRLSVTGNVTFDANSTYIAELNGNTAGSGYDQLSVTGAVALGNGAANLDLRLISGFTPTAGDQFVIIDGGSISGFFKGLPDGQTFVIGNDAYSIDYTMSGDVVITVQVGSKTVVTTSGSPSQFGTPVTFTATVSPLSGSGTTPAGTVTFVDASNNDAVLASGVSLDANGQASTPPITNLSVGTHTIRADYSGDSLYIRSSGTVQQVITQVTSSVDSIDSSQNPSTYGEEITFTVMISTATGVAPTGTVNFRDFSHSIDLGTIPITAADNGQAIFTTKSIIVGTSVIRVTFNGQGNFTNSQRDFTPGQTVTQGATTTTVASLNSPTVFGQVAQIQATVSPVSPSTLTPVGNVTFFDMSNGGANLGTVAVDANGKATLQTPNLSVGTHLISATYVHPNNYYASSSSSTSASHMVTPASTTTSIESSADPSVFGQLVNLTAVVSASPGILAPTGTVDIFIDGMQVADDLALSNGRATYSTASLSLGAHSVTAVYTSNSSNFLNSDNLANPFSQDVNAAPTQTVITSSRNPSSPNVPVTFTATVSAPSSTLTPTGSVTFFVDGNQVATVTLNSGQATYTTSSLGVGTHTVTATYASDTAGFLNSASNVFQELVRRNYYAAGSVAVSPIATTQSQPQVRVYDATTDALVFSIFAYPGYLGDVRVAIGDVNGDGITDIITGTGAGTGGHIKVFSGTDGATLLYSFIAYTNFNGGTFVGAGDINGDGRADIITGTDLGNSPHVKVFSGADGSLIRSFFAYAPGFIGGVRVASGDVNGDGRADIVTAAGGGAGPHVKAFSGITNAELLSFFAYPTSYTGGVFVAAGDIDGDGRAEIFTGTGNTTSHVRVIDTQTLTDRLAFLAFPGSTVGVTVGAVDRDGDGRADIVTGAASQAPHVKIFKGTNLALLDSFFAFSPTVRGTFVGGSM